MSCNLYLTDMPEKKLKQIFCNAKNFYMLDVQNIINSMGIDPHKNTSVYLINEEIQKIIKQQAVLKKVQGIFYIVNKITEPLYKALKKRVESWSEISDIVLIDNGQFPTHSDVMHLFSDVIFYERFRKNKIIACNSLSPEDESNDSLAKALQEINNLTNDFDE